jgi:4-hydroxybenzoate polyprenyltransferase
MRLDKPIGILLVLWPTYWSLWLAARGVPAWDNLVIFTLGCLLMRSAGCVINDYADRHFDGHVQRTQSRPLATGLITTTEALLLFVVLCALAFSLVLLTNPLTIKLSLGGVALAIIYPFMKRYTYMPQVFLGAAFAWSIPMAFAAELNQITPSIWLLYVAVVVWAVIYDTFYAMVDREDDLKIGVKSTAILFGDADRVITTLLQGLFLLTLVLAGRRFELTWPYFVSLLGVAALFVYQQKLIKDRNRELCFKAFLNNNYVGMIVFVGIWVSFYF